MRHILLITRTTLLVICLSIFLAGSGPFALPKIQARTVEQIQQDINAKNGDLKNLQNQLAQAQKDLEQIDQASSGANSELQILQNQLAQLDSQLKIKQLQIDSINQQKQLKTLEFEEQEHYQDQQVTDSYLSWKSGGLTKAFFGAVDPVKISMYNQALSNDSEDNILGIQTELDSIQQTYNGYFSESTSLQGQLTKLAQQKAQAQANYDQIKAQQKKTSTDVSNIRNQQSQLQSQIDLLSQEQKAVQDQEQKLLQQQTGNSSGTKELITGQFYIYGQGRDLYQGHGIGMSQYGALGAGLQGWDYQKITNFYFTGTSVASNIGLPTTINVDGVGQVPIEDYVAGLGEIPDKACEDLGIAFNPNNFWYCWPRETIKAQVVVARTYAARRSGFVYRDSRSQVYKGGTAKAWAAKATAGQVVSYGGKLADVYYSSDNNQGWGTANNDTVWSNFSGVGSALPYLRNVNDNSFAYKSSWTTWQWRTNSYTMADLDKFLNWAGSSSQVSSSTRTFVASLKSTIGNLKSLSLERDPSQRVRKITLTGDKGSKVMAGWLFKSIWNLWVGNVKPSGQTDYLYSLTYFWKQN